MAYPDQQGAPPPYMAQPAPMVPPDFNAGPAAPPPIQPQASVYGQPAYPQPQPQAQPPPMMNEKAMVSSATVAAPPLGQPAYVIGPNGQPMIMHPQYGLMPVMAPGMQQQMAPATVTVAVQQAQPTIAIVSTTLGTMDCQVTCPNCHQVTMTRTETRVGSYAWRQCVCYMLIGLFLFLPLLLCCWIPCVVRSNLDIVHYCRNCNHHIGTYER